MNIVYLLVGVALGFVLGAVTPRRDECPYFLRWWWKNASKKIDDGASVTIILSTSDEPVEAVDSPTLERDSQWRYN